MLLNRNLLFLNTSRECDVALKQREPNKEKLLKSANASVRSRNGRARLTFRPNLSKNRFKFTSGGREVMRGSDAPRSGVDAVGRGALVGYVRCGAAPPSVGLRVCGALGRAKTRPRPDAATSRGQNAAGGAGRPRRCDARATLRLPLALVTITKCGRGTELSPDNIP